MAVRAGFILGKEFDFVDSPGSIVDTSFLDDLPSEYRKRSAKPRMTWPGMTVDPKDHISADVAIAWYIKKRYPEIEVDFIFPQDIKLDRLKSNTCNFVVGYDILDALCEGEEQLAEVENAFRNCGNIMPSWEVQEAIYMKSKYMKKATDLGIPVAPTIYASQQDRNPESLLSEIQSRGWKTFLIKQSYSCGSIGLKKLQVADCEANIQILQDYFDEYAECPEYIVQEFIEGFSRNWEVRCFWFNSQFLYAIGNRAAFSTAEGEKVGIISEDELPPHFLQRAKEIGWEALKSLPDDNTLTCIRTDVGCADSEIHDKDYQHWNDIAQTFFLNEVEYGGTTYFPRALKFDCIPLWADHYAKKALEIHQTMKQVPFGKLLQGGYFKGNGIASDTCSTSASNLCGLPSYSDKDATTDEDSVSTGSR